jgi:hypothetical protein
MGGHRRQSRKFYARERFNCPPQSDIDFSEVKWATIPGGEEWVIKPVKAGLVKYESLLDGTVGLDDIALLNDFLMVESVNENLARKAVENNSGKKLGPQEG